MTERHFRVVQLEGKKVEIGGVSISEKASPGNAARKLLTSIAHHKGLKKNKKASMGKVKFSIQEYTQGSSKKVYGPYVGHYHKYTGAELKKAMTADGKVKFTMKPVVKLAKGNMKVGGVFPPETLQILFNKIPKNNSYNGQKVAFIMKIKNNYFDLAVIKKLPISKYKFNELMANPANTNANEQIFEFQRNVEFKLIENYFKLNVHDILVHDNINVSPSNKWKIL